RNGLYSTAHVGLALRTNDGVLHFMHASSPGNSGRVIVDARLSQYLYRYRSDSGLLVARPLRYSLSLSRTAASNFSSSSTASSASTPYASSVAAAPQSRFARRTSMRLPAEYR